MSDHLDAPSPAPTIPLSRVMLHELANHLTIALGNADLLLLDGTREGAELTEIRDACGRAVDLVNQWRTRFADAPGAPR